MHEKKRWIMLVEACLGLLLLFLNGTTYAGCVLSLSVDDMESYTDAEGFRGAGSSLIS